MDIKVRLADWRDRQAIQALRRHLSLPLDGGLYELLNWPIYHVHAALVDNETIGFGAVLLFPNGQADDVGLAVRDGIDILPVQLRIRYTQARDLGAMGWQVLYTAARDPAAPAKLGFQPVGNLDIPGLGQYTYMGATIPTILKALAALGIPDPHPLGQNHLSRLLVKAARVKDHNARLSAVAEFHAQKAVLRNA